MSKATSLGPFSWAFERKARLLKPEDSFFEDGNRACFADAKHYVKEQDVEQLSMLFSSIDANLGSDDALECDVKGCKEKFKSVRAYELHVASLHKFSCDECKRNFPTNFLLDVHITENHDSFFQAKKERGDNVHVCLVEACCEMFTTDDERHKHLIEVHKYPSDFRFNKKRKPRKLQMNTSDNVMDVDESTDKASSISTEKELSKAEKGIEVKGVPKTINFGRGSSKAFYSRGRGRARKR